MYYEEISAMMCSFGDVQMPKMDSVKRMYLILRDQMNLLLCEAEKIVYFRGSKDQISHEDVIFLMRKSKIKLRRLIKYLSIWDFKEQLKSPLNAGKDYSSHIIAKGERVKKCLDFLAIIEDCDEFTSFVLDENVNDLGALKRQMRRYWKTYQMDMEEYKAFSNISQACFGPVEKFKSWLLADKATNLNLTDCAVNIAEFLARETIAEMVDFILLMKMKKLGKQLPVSYEDLSKSVSFGTRLNLNIPDTTEGILNRYYDSEINEPCTHSTGDIMCSTCAEDVCMEESSDDVVHDDCKQKNDSSCKNKIEEDSKFLRVSDNTQGNEKLAQILPEKQDDSKYGTVSHPECSVEKMDKSCDIQSSSSSTMSDNEILKGCQSSPLSSLQEMSNPSSDSSHTERQTIGTLSQGANVAVIEDISDTSDSEDGSDDFSDYREERSFRRNYHARWMNQEEFIDPSDSANYLKLAAKNEVLYVSPIEPAEIGEAFARFQEPSEILYMFATDSIPKKAKLISLSESIYLI